MLFALVECRFLLVVMSCKSSMSIGCSLIWKVLCPRIRTIIHQVVFPGQMLITEWWWVRAHDYYIEPHISLGSRLSETRDMSGNNVCPLSLFFFLIKTIYFSCTTWWFNIHTHSEMITVIKPINMFSFTQLAFFSVCGERTWNLLF